MKILKVRLQNLNSLVGEWRIDFTDPAYRGNGIFAITGPTGAGKSTILDAICLALFGCTPRLDRVNKSANEIMSRHCGKCLAEVEFSTSRGGHYRCTWSQQRARGKADGTLQQQEHEIADLASGKPLETKLSAVVPKVEEVTGMNFERFTRSMLLAQGSFAAFLQADPDKRSPILEGITGTSIYTEISELVHQRNSDEKQQLEILTAELNGMTLLSADEEQQQRAELADADSAIAELEKRIAALQAAIDWHQRLAELNQGLAAVQPQKQQLDAAIAAFAADRERLTAALRALECDAEYGKYDQLRADLNKKTAALRASNEGLPKLQEQVAKADAEATAAVACYQAVKTAQNALAPQLRQARELDRQINESKRLLAAAEKSLGETSKHICVLQDTLAGDNATQASSEHRRVQLHAELDKCAEDGVLVEQLAAIRGTFTQLQQARKDLDKAQAELSKAAEAKTTAEDDVARGKKDHSRLLTAANLAADQLTAAQTALKNVLRNMPLEDWQDQRQSLLDQLRTVQQAQESHAVYARLLKEQEDLTQECKKHLDGIAALTTTLGAKGEVRQVQEALVSSLEDKLLAAKLIEDYKQARQALADGKPCPLCGATDHPFAAGNIPVVSVAQQQLDEARKMLVELGNEMQRLEVAQQSHQRTAEQAETRLKRLALDIPAAITRLNEFSAKAAPTSALTADTPALAEELQQLMQQLEAKAVAAASVLEQAKIGGRTVEARKKDAEKASQAVHAAEITLLSAEAKVENAKQNLLAKTDACTTAQQRLDECRRQALESVRPYGYDAISEDRLDSINKALQQRLDDWQKRQRALAALDREIPTLAAKIEQSTEEHNRLTAQQSKQNAELATQQRELAELQTSRTSVLGGKAADDEETRVANELENAETRRDTTTKHRQDCQQKLQEIETIIRNLQNDISELKANTTRADEAFLQAIAARSFSDEAAFLAARLPELERKALQKKDHDLTQGATALASKEKTLNEQLAAEENKALSSEPRESLETQRTAQTTALEQLREKRGTLRNGLDTNEQAKEKHQDKTASLDTQRQSCAKWQMLHDLIGSSDGKKFRDFAQGLTFEIVIRHANVQLRKMSDRYLLRSDPGSPLELNVEDNYQAGDIRSTKNLSGGESFIVSLALALGLSNMASKNVRIDSLFLDEGFGALDENALNSALDALAGLQQEGKVIGVISHVGMLKDRINTQIQVSPIKEGRSRLDGPGCSQGNSEKEKAEPKAKRKKQSKQPK